MRLKHQLRLLVTILAVGSLAMPIAAQAGGKHCGKKYSSCCMRNGIIFNETDGKYYPVPGTKGGYVYRSVDGKYVKVTEYGTCYKRMVNVTCQATPGHWWNTTWMAPSHECWYVR